MLAEAEGGEEHPKAASLAAQIDGEAAVLKHTAALAAAAEAAFPLGAGVRTLDPAAAAAASELARAASDGMLVP